MKSRFTHEEIDANRLHIESIVLQVKSMVSSKAGEGMVGISWESMAGIMTPREARELALKILECASAAESDEELLNFLHSKSDLPIVQCAEILKDLRECRRK